MPQLHVPSLIPHLQSCIGFPHPANATTRGTENSMYVIIPSLPAFPPKIVGVALLSFYFASTREREKVYKEM